MTTIRKPLKSSGVTLVPLKVQRGQEVISEILEFCGGMVHIGGGFARWCLSPLDKPAPYQDVDLFVKDSHDRDLVLDRLQRLHQTNHSGTAISYEYFSKDRRYTLQFIYPVKGNIEQTYGKEREIAESFDFTICQAFLNNSYEGLASNLFERDETNKKLRVYNAYNPLSSMHRAFKYTKLGYKISSKEMVKLFYQWDCITEKHKVAYYSKFAINTPIENDIDDVDEEALPRLY